MRAVLVAGSGEPGTELLRSFIGLGGLSIAVDRGVEAFLAAGLVPDVLIGDLDSASPEAVRAACGAGAEVVRYPSAKNETDLELAARLAVSRGAGEVVILGATGGRIDHLLGNLGVLLWLAEQGVEASLADGQQTITASEGLFRFTGRTGDTVSVVPAAGRAVVSAEGLRYPLQALELRADSARGISNVVCAPEVSIRSEGPVFVIRNVPGKD